MIDQLGTATDTGMIGISELPSGYFVKDDDSQLQIALYTKVDTSGSRTNVLKYPDQVATMKTTIAGLVQGLTEDDITVIPYYANPESSEKLSVADGKIIVNYDHDIGSGQAAYQVWVGSWYDDSTGDEIATSDINSPVLAAKWDQLDSQT